MDKLKVLLQKLGIELTADQTKQITEVIEKEFVPAADVAANKTKLDELTKQLAARDKDLAKLKADNKSEELQKQLDELNAKYKQDTDDLNAKLSAQQADFAAEKLFGGYKFASDRVRKSVLDEFKGKGFKNNRPHRRGNQGGLLGRHKRLAPERRHCNGVRVHCSRRNARS